MKASGAVLEIDNSVYFEDVRQACQQIILKAVITDIRQSARMKCDGPLPAADRRGNKQGRCDRLLIAFRCRLS